jgi:large subunit ribosomal protein L10
MARPDKASTVAELADHFCDSNAAVLTEYRGLTVAQLKTLRRSLGSTVTYAVVKNTLTKIAAKDAGVTGVDDLLAGPSAIAFVKGDAVEAAKAIRNFAKENPALVIKGGYMDGKTLSAADVQKIADLESREVLLSKLAGAMKAKQSQAAALFAAPLSKTARALGALQTKLEADPSAAKDAAPAEAPAPAVAEETPAEAPAEATDVDATAETATEETPETAAEAVVEETPEG